VKVLAIAIVVILLVIPVSAETIDIPVFRDGVMDSDVPDDTVWNYRNNPRIGLDSTGTRAYRAWLMFQIDAIPEGKTILSVEVRMILSSRISAHVDLVEATNPSTMGEGSVTWNNSPTLGDTLQSYVWLSPNDWVLKFNSQAVTDSVQAFYGDDSSYWGCVMKEVTTMTGGYALWYARESSYDPVLRVTFCNKAMGDLNDDCVVNFVDFAIFAQDWLTCGYQDPNMCLSVLCNFIKDI
jgi:hypothetical protein